MQSHNVDVHTYDGLDLEAIATVPEGEARGMLVMAHGITVDLHEGGMFDRLAEAASLHGWATLRFLLPRTWEKHRHATRCHNRGRGDRPGVRNP